MPVDTSKIYKNKMYLHEIIKTNYKTDKTNNMKQQYSYKSHACLLKKGTFVSYVNS